MRHALEITSVHRIRPTPEERTRASRTSLLRRRYPAPNDGVEVKDLRPLAVGPRGPIPDPDAATGAAQKRRRTTEKRSTIRVRPSLTSPVPFRDDNAGQQLFDVPIGEPVAQVPAHSHRDHLRRESEPGEAGRWHWRPRVATTHQPSLPEACHR